MSEVIRFAKPKLILLSWPEAKSVDQPLPATITVSTLYRVLTFESGSGAPAKSKLPQTRQPSQVYLMGARTARRAPCLTNSKEGGCRKGECDFDSQVCNRLGYQSLRATGRGW